MSLNKPLPIEPDLLACEACLAEIPDSVGQTPEGQDYIQHYCGLDCYDTWRQHADAPSTPTQ